MARKEKNIHYIYKTTCNVTGRWYIGKHSCYDINDGYMGSGTVLRRSIRKYGIEQHTKEILEYCESKEVLNFRENEIVNSVLIQDPNCMNLMCGGSGGATMTGRKHSDETKKKMSLVHMGKTIPEKVKKKISIKVSETLIGNQRAKGNKNWVGKKHKKESLELMRENHPLTKIIEMYSLNGELIGTFKSLHEAEEKTGNLRKHISRCCRGLAKTCGKHIWKFKE